MASEILTERAARVHAEERATRAEEHAADLGSALAVATSIAEVSIATVTLLVEEARCYAAALAEAAFQDRRSITEAASASAFQVIAEARAAVADLRAHLLEEDRDDDAVEGRNIPGQADDDLASNRHSTGGRSQPGPVTSEAPSLAVHRLASSSHAGTAPWIPVSSASAEGAS